MNISLIPSTEFSRMRQKKLDPYEQASLFADMCRCNTLAVIKRAGSGHLGSSLSAMDLVAWLYLKRLNILSVGFDSPDRDIYFSSKGHDVPGLYSVLFALGAIPRNRFLKLRRLGGLDGHPDIGIPGIEANSGSLGMGISKARGMAWAKRRQGHGGHIFVLVGDGELQEGQNYEALHATMQQNISLTVIVDCNKVQSDKPVAEIMDLGDLEAKFRVFGWQVSRIDGHDLRQIEGVLATKPESTHPNLPHVIIADTIKGRGISFMEHPAALRNGKGYYSWHSGAPPDDIFVHAYTELVDRVQAKFTQFGLGDLKLEEIAPEQGAAPRSMLGEPVSTGSQKKLSTGAEYIADAYGQTLVELAKKHPELVVLDGDLAADCRVRAFELAYPDRFIENGIAEQDMVSMAGGLARQGLLPVVNSFASFLAARANEQIYNNACEKTKVIYACHYAGLIPAGPGKSHQSLRDISLLGALPNCIILQPANSLETRLALEFAVEKAPCNVALRLIIGPSPRDLKLPENYRFKQGHGVVLHEGNDAVLFAYGPVILHEALLCAERLREKQFSLKVVNLPWLNRVDFLWLTTVIGDCQRVFVLEDHAPIGGLGDYLLHVLSVNAHPITSALRILGVEGFPACGTPTEVLRYHQIDGESLAWRIFETVKS
jgi:transketolase